MADVVIYTKPSCPYCISAKALLQAKEVEFKEINISGQDELRSEMIAKANGRTTVPQIFIGDTHVGGCDDLYALDHEKKLDDLLAS